MMLLQLGTQLLHGATRAGAGSKQQNLLRAPQTFGNVFVKTLALGHTLAVGIVRDAMQVPAKSLWVERRDPYWHRAFQVGLEDPGLAVIDHDEQMMPLRVGGQLCCVRTLEEMADSHKFLDLGDVLVAIGLHDQRLAVSGHSQLSIGFLFDFGQFVQEPAKIAPFEIVRRRMSKNRLISTAVRSCE